MSASTHSSLKKKKDREPKEKAAAQEASSAGGGSATLSTSENAGRSFLVLVADKKFRLTTSVSTSDELKKQLTQSYSIGYPFDLQYYDAEVAEYLDFTSVSLRHPFRRACARRCLATRLLSFARTWAVAAFFPRSPSRRVCSFSALSAMDSFVDRRLESLVSYPIVAFVDALYPVVVLWNKQFRFFCRFNKNTKRRTVGERHSAGQSGPREAAREENRRQRCAEAELGRYSERQRGSKSVFFSLESWPSVRGTFSDVAFRCSRTNW